MARLDELHALVSSLSQGEKRHFRRLLADLRKPGESQAMQLFELLCRQPEMTPGALQDKIKEAGLGKNLATVIPRLNQQILKSVVHLKTSDNVDARLYQMLGEIKVLYAKHLYAQGMRMIKTARRVAHEYSRTNLELELLSWERRFFIDANSQATDLHLSTLRAEGQRLLDLLQLQLQLRQLQSEARAASRKNLSPKKPEDAPQLAQFWREDLFTLAEASDDGLSQLLAGSVQGIYHTLLRDFQAAYEALLPVMRLWEGNAKWVEDKAELLLIVFNNFFNAAIVALNDMAPLEHFLNLIRKIRFKDEVLQFRSRRMVYTQEFIYCLNYARFGRGKTLASRIEVWLPQVKDRLSRSQWIMFHYNLSIFYFLSDNFSAANRSLLVIHQLPAGPIRNDARRVCALLRILVQYQLGNVDLCESMVRNARRGFQAQIEGDHPHMKALRGLGPVLKALPGEDLREQLHQLIRSLDGIQPFLGQQEIILWAESMLKGNTIQGEFEQLVAAIQGK